MGPIVAGRFQGQRELENLHRHMTQGVMRRQLISAGPLTTFFSRLLWEPRLTVSAASQA